LLLLLLLLLCQWWSQQSLDFTFRTRSHSHSGGAVCPRAALGSLQLLLPLGSLDLQALGLGLLLQLALGLPCEFGSLPLRLDGRVDSASGLGKVRG